MSGYKRVNFYELCRLCATNQQKDKTHIFQEEGRKIQLQNKIQSCLSLKVCENDFLPKVVCSQCLRTLEECCIFRKECYTSETMLSSYFNNFRYTEDFKKSGKVYIKDTSPKVTIPSDMCTPPNTTVNSSTSYNVSVVPNINNNVSQEAIPYYTLQLPTVVPQTNEGKPSKEQKVVTQPQIVYNLNTIKTVMPKTNQMSEIGNVTVNSNGEILTIAPLVDVDALFSQNIIQKSQRRSHRKHKIVDTSGKGTDNSNIIKIDLTQPEIDFKRDNTTVDKLKLQQNKVTYTVKLDDSFKNPLELNGAMNINRNATYNPNQSVILNPAAPRLNNIPNMNRAKTYLNFSNVNLGTSVPTSSNISIATVPISNMNSVSSLSTDSVSNMNAASNLNLSVSTYNPTQSLQYPITNSKQENQHIDCSVNITSDIFNAVNPAGVTTTANSCPDSLRSSSLSSTPVHNLNSSLSSAPVHNLNSSLSSTPVHNLNSSLSSTPVHNLNFQNLSVSPPFSTTSTNQSTFTNPPNVDSSKQDPGTAKKHTCDICCKTFKRREHLYQHVKLHTGFRPFKCENCNKSFMRKEHLLRHMTSHSGQKNFTCSICEKSFSRNDNLLKHKKIHNKQNSFTCEVCQKQFVMEHYYFAHKRTHDNEKCSVNQMWGLLKAV